MIHREGALTEESVESLREEGAVFAIESQQLNGIPSDSLKVMTYPNWTYSKSGDASEMLVTRLLYLLSLSAGVFWKWEASQGQITKGHKGSMRYLPNVIKGIVP